MAFMAAIAFMAFIALAILEEVKGTGDVEDHNYWSPNATKQQVTEYMAHS